ncbi:MAG: TraB/GumN family protein [Algoriphagus sp.]|uniref:TraB/GumN family protein n=1 Tax=Algoriphagus sp. TaxID=1872435 RepID=UPI00272EFBBF|nr:TraB/GumN family protein [Algoriphagus sp.]MDP2041457.1 TraB/GumN family protein [Algoriphagus sp.]MDP3471011.1 TraB/GumN family protein [Algoriphagus sp.]
MKSKIFKKIGLAILLVVHFVGSVNGQDSSLLWKVSGNGLEKESFLFGTIHIICKSDFLMDERIINAFESAEQLFLELDMSDPQLQLKMQQVSLNPGMKNIKAEMDESAASALDAFLLENYGAGLAQLGILKPFVLSSMVMLKALPCTEIESYEGYFTSRAGEAEMPIVGLETVEFQVGIFDQIPRDLQLKELVKLVTEEGAQQEFQTMISAYLAEDILALDQAMTNSGMMADYRSILLEERNKNWVPQMEEAMKAKSIFMAVGAGHLGGDFGVISLLRKAGYSVEPIH